MNKGSVNYTTITRRGIMVYDYNITIRALPLQLIYAISDTSRSDTKVALHDCLLVNCRHRRDLAVCLIGFTALLDLATLLKFTIGRRDCIVCA
jgi:hypothetical protein